MIVYGSSVNALVAAILLARRGEPVCVVETPQLAFPWRVDDRVWTLLGEPAPPVQHGVEGLDGLLMTRSGLSGVPAGDAARWPEFVSLLDSCVASLDAEHWRALPQRLGSEVLRLPWMPLRDLLDEWFTSDVLKGTLAALALRGVAQGPYAAGTVFNLLHQWAWGEVLDVAPCVLDRLKEAALAAGVSFSDRPFTLEEPVLCDADVRRVFTQLVSPTVLETAFNMEVARVRFRGCAALAHMPVAAPRKVVIAPSLDSVERAYDATKYGRCSAEPFVIFGGGWVWAQYFPYGAPADCAVVESVVRRYRPDIEWKTPLWLLPADLERQYGFTEGHLFGGETTLDQMFFLRSGFQTPIAGLRLIGPTVHPGTHSGLAALQVL